MVGRLLFISINPLNISLNKLNIVLPGGFVVFSSIDSNVAPDLSIIILKGCVSMYKPPKSVARILISNVPISEI